MADLPPGSAVAGCRIEAVLGRGGMGVVYRATQISLERAVALKVIAPELAVDADFRERFKRESRLAARIEHPNVIPVYEAGEGDGQLYLIMRYIEGTDLRALVETEGALAGGRAARIVGQVADALAAAHRRGLVHRDIKPANVLIDSAGGSEHAYLTDFGIAREVEATSALTRTGMVVGTVDYLAPERLQDGASGADASSDIYALGCVLFETLTGQVPYPRDSQVAKMFAHLNDPVPSAREMRSDVPEALDRIARKAMAKDPDERFGSAADVAEALAAHATGATPVPETVRRAASTVAAATVPAAPPEPAAPTVRAGPAAPPRRRRPRLVVLGGAVLIGAVVAGGAALLAGGGSKTKKSSGGGKSTAISPRALAAVQLGPGADGIAAGAGSVWVADKDDALVTRVNPRTRRVAGRIGVGANPDSLVVGEGGVWVTNTDDDNVSRIDSSTKKVTATVPVGDAPEGIAVGEGAVWAANQADGTVTRIRGSGATKSFPAGGKPIQIVVAKGIVWVTASADGTVVGLDPSTGKRKGSAVQVGGSPRGIAYSNGLLWISASKANTVVAVDPSSRRVRARIKVPDNPREVRAGEGAVWVTCADAGVVAAIDPASRKVVAKVSVKGAPFGLAVGEGGVWAGSLDTGQLTPIDPRAE